MKTLLNPKHDLRRAPDTRLALVARDVKQALGESMCDGCHSTLRRLLTALERTVEALVGREYDEANVELANARMDTRHAIERYNRNHLREALVVIESVGFHTMKWES